MWITYYTSPLREHDFLQILLSRILRNKSGECNKIDLSMEGYVGSNVSFFFYFYTRCSCISCSLIKHSKLQSALLVRVNYIYLMKCLLISRSWIFYFQNDIMMLKCFKNIKTKYFYIPRLLFEYIQNSLIGPIRDFMCLHLTLIITCHVRNISQHRT